MARAKQGGYNKGWTSAKFKTEASKGKWHDQHGAEDTYAGASQATTDLYNKKRKKLDNEHYKPGGEASQKRASEYVARHERARGWAKEAKAAKLKKRGKIGVAVAVASAVGGGVAARRSSHKGIDSR